MNHTPTDDKRLHTFAGVLIGTAVDDSLGLPAEGMSRGRIQRHWRGVAASVCLGTRDGERRHGAHVVCRPGAFDSSRRCRRLSAVSRLEAPSLVARFASGHWPCNLEGHPSAVGGVFAESKWGLVRREWTGNAQRDHRCLFADDPDKRRAFASAATRLTHTDPKAETAALAVAEVVAWAANHGPPTLELLTQLRGLGQDEEWQTIFQKLVTALDSGRSVEELADVLGLQNNVTGYAYHSVPIALYAFLLHSGDFRMALDAALDCGGDTDTVGAIVGALAGAQVGKQGIPADLIAGIWEWLRSVALLEHVAARLAQQKDIGQPLGPVQYFWLVLILRNLAFLIVVLLHGFRRLTPPY